MSLSFPSKQTTSLMSLSRFEAFSDGVFAIAATLLALEIRVADLSNATHEQAAQALLHLLPHIISYSTSFIVIGVIWLNHHALFHFVKRVDRISLTINLFFANVHCLHSLLNCHCWAVQAISNSCCFLWLIFGNHWISLQYPLVLCAESIYQGRKLHSETHDSVCIDLEYWLSDLLSVDSNVGSSEFNLESSALRCNFSVLSPPRCHRSTVDGLRSRTRQESIS